MRIEVFDLSALSKNIYNKVPHPNLNTPNLFFGGVVETSPFILKHWAVI